MRLALRKIIPYGNQLLRKQSERISAIDDEIRTLVADMTDTLQTAKGVGLAAPQVGVSKMLFLMDWTNIQEEGGLVKAYINPEIVSKSDELLEEPEGCLSLPEVWAEVERPESVKVRFKNLEGIVKEEVLDGLAARVFQHEYDHLLGILLIDRLSPRDRVRLRDKLKAIMDGKIVPFSGESLD